MEYLEHRARAVWALVRCQHGVIARWQLIELGMHPQAIKRRIASGRLHSVYRGVYAVGRPDLTQLGRFMAAILACGPGAFLSHESAAILLGILHMRSFRIHVSKGAESKLKVPGVVCHRRPSLRPDEITTHRDIPVTCVVRTLIDLAATGSRKRLEAAVNAADKRGLVDPESLRAALENHAGEPGVRALRSLLDRDTFRLTDSDLERSFLAIVRRAGLPLPGTQVRHERGRADFTWTSLGLVVETDGLRYHRTPLTQAEDNRRMQAHAEAGRSAVRFSHFEVRHEAGRVGTTLVKLVERLHATH